MAEFSHQLSGRDLWAWRSQARAQAQAHQIDLAEVDWLLRGLCQVEPLSLRLGTLAQAVAVPAQVTVAELAARWQARVSDRVPIQHLVGTVAWRDFTLQVSPAVLIPRPETELVIDLVMAWVAQRAQATPLRQGTWVDLGTGSGAIALGLAQALPQAKIVAVDVSAAALAIAQQNALNNSLSDRIQFLQGSWFEPLTVWRGQLAGIVSNPPYIPTAVVSTLEPEVAQHEPPLALDGGDDGLADIRHLVATAPDYLVSGGLWLVEHMQGQAVDIEELLTATDQFRAIQSVPDLAGCDRFVQAVRR
ncbi:peptide chain release factor N(5)-glutamine methyltransferase [Halomicronema sp. CCY15110]|uniref:peptide chain release factor N(5)-glutamine methyltransferase n=1 Tax=Halomicronema sp. CCY15110 TaxID=2767773 RepID=UPI0028165D2A|nr:peptide chain release factor N(5)-glutamine methyltransferase [Halomicronema sp. CCY15110]